MMIMIIIIIVIVITVSIIVRVRHLLEYHRKSKALRVSIIFGVHRIIDPGGRLRVRRPAGLSQRLPG